MKFLLAGPMLVFAFLLSLVTGLTAKKAPYRIWQRLCTSILLLLVESTILFCAVGDRRKKPHHRRAVENDEIFDHLFADKRKKIRVSRWPAA